MRESSSFQGKSCGFWDSRKWLNCLSRPVQSTTLSSFRGLIICSRSVSLRLRRSQLLLLLPASPLFEANENDGAATPDLIPSDSRRGRRSSELGLANV